MSNSFYQIPQQPNQLTDPSQVTPFDIGYTRYEALLTQAASGNPTAVILKNDTGLTLTFARTSQGVYTITRNTGNWNLVKTQVMIPNLGVATQCGVASGVDGDGTAVLRFKTYDILLSGGTPNDGMLTNTPLNIRIYP